ncbi:MAG: transcriptional regulator, BadM/Rrf2 family [Bacteroidetes bacterium]|nr:transcriptional regulator, BadM/Rrf2 family [Bacteroidota bacterium]
MSIIFSRRCEYALQAVLYLALKEGGEKTSIKELTHHIQIPSPFLAKILQDLTHTGLLKSGKGPHGGFALAKPAREITMFQIVEAMDGTAFTNGCVLGFTECSTTTPCAMHDEWSGIRDRIADALKKKDLAVMAKQMRKPEYLEA